MTPLNRSTEAKNSPFYVAMRDAERRLYREILEATGGDIDVAASLLGINRKQIVQRARDYGGVFEGDPIHEPPLSVQPKVSAPDTGEPKKRGRPPKPSSTGDTQAAAATTKPSDPEKLAKQREHMARARAAKEAKTRARLTDTQAATPDETPAQAAEPEPNEPTTPHEDISDRYTMSATGSRCYISGDDDAAAETSEPDDGLS